VWCTHLSACNSDVSKIKVPYLVAVGVAGSRSRLVGRPRVQKAGREEVADKVLGVPEISGGIDLMAARRVSCC
jgi:hypothetical protein